MFSVVFWLISPNHDYIYIYIHQKHLNGFHWMDVFMKVVYKIWLWGLFILYILSIYKPTLTVFFLKKLRIFTMLNLIDITKFLVQYTLSINIIDILLQVVIQVHSYYAINIWSSMSAPSHMTIWFVLWWSWSNAEFDEYGLSFRPE